MSDTFRFLDDASTGESAAQSFLAKKMAGNQYASTPDIDYDKPIADADVQSNNASVESPYSMGEGTVATGPAYSNSGTSGGRSGALSSEEIRNKFGLEYNEAHVNGKKDHPNGSNNETGAIYQRETGEYIGTIKNKETAGKDFGSIRQYAKDSGLIQEDIDDYNSLNDVASLASQIHGNSGSGSSSDEGSKPIKHSPEIRQAKSRIQQYEEGILSGETSNSIFGSGATEQRGDYELNLTEGQAGIGTENSGADVGEEATKSFLDSKKAEVKGQYKFIPK